MSFYVHSNHRCDMHMKMSFVVFYSIVLPLWLPLWCPLSSFACFHIVISHSTICSILVNFPYIILCFWWWCLFNTLWYTKSAFFAFAVVMHFSHHIDAFLCYYSVDLFIRAVAIMRYDCKLALNTIAKKLSMVGICKPWANF
jgi:hypothetical protein